MKNLLFILILSLFACFVSAKEPVGKQKEKFSFAFFTDIHLNNNSPESWDGLNKAIKNAKANQVDFILTGGDNVDIDVLKKDDKTAHKMMQGYAKVIDKSGIDYYATIGNHDRFWGCKKTDVLYNEGLFEKYINESYYSFNHKGWHFIVLNTTQTNAGNYSYHVDEQQKQWLINDLKSVDAETPIIISVHVPFLSVYYPALEGIYKATDTFSNFKAIWDLFKNHNLKLVLQGHQHLYEEIKTLGVQFITGGAVCASWWGGNYHGTEEGYLKINIKGKDFDWEYVDYGWEATTK